MDPIVCQWSECGIVVAGSADLDFHWLQHLIEDPVSCLWANCFHVFPARQSIEGKMFHLRQAHTSHRPFECDKCERKYVAESFLELHKFRIHDQKKNLCLCPFLDCNFNSEELLDLSGHCIAVHGAEGLKSLVKILDGNPADLLFPNDIDRSMQSRVPHLKQILLKSLLKKTAEFTPSRPIKSDLTDLPNNLLSEPSTSNSTNQRYSPNLHVADTIEISPFESREFSFPTSASPMLPGMTTPSSSVTPTFIQPAMAPLPSEGVPQSVPLHNMGYYMHFLSNPILHHQPAMEASASLSVPQQLYPPPIQHPDPHFQPVLSVPNYGPPMAQTESTPSLTPSVISIPVEKNGPYNVCKVDLSHSHRVIHKTVQIPCSRISNAADPRIQYSFYWKCEQLKEKQETSRNLDPRLKRDRPDSSPSGDQKRQRIYFDAPKASYQPTHPYRGKRGRPRSPQGYNRSGYQGKHRSFSPLEISPERPKIFEKRPKGHKSGFDEESEGNRGDNRERAPRSQSRSPRDQKYEGKSYYRGQKNIRRSSRGRSASRDRGGYRGYSNRKFEETPKFVSKYARSSGKSANSSPAKRSHGEDGNSPESNG
uniref:C2H2-type domain-containing protein n=2 Tax=Bursaphelenchus xylophilus TaxID=6326 RepID=A0A1I7SB27_BURXY